MSTMAASPSRKGVSAQLAAPIPWLFNVEGMLRCTDVSIHIATCFSSTLFLLHSLLYFHLLCCGIPGVHLDRRWISILRCCGAVNRIFCADTAADAVSSGSPSSSHYSSVFSFITCGFYHKHYLYYHRPPWIPPLCRSPGEWFTAYLPNVFLTLNVFLSAPICRLFVLLSGSGLACSSLFLRTGVQ